MESGSVVRHGVGITRMGHPIDPYLSLGSRPNRPIDSGDPLASPRWRFHRWALQTLPGKAEGCLRVAAPHFPCPGHIPLARRRPVGQAASRQPGPRPAARLSALNRGKGEGFPPIVLPFFNHCCFSFLLFAKPVRVSWWFLGERRERRTHRFIRKSKA